MDTKEKIEDKIIDWITVKGSGHLICFKPENGSVFIDLAIKKRGEYREGTEIFLKIGYCDKNIKGKIYVCEIPKENLFQGDGWYLIFVYFDIVLQDILKFVWLVPAHKFLETAKENKKGNLVFEAPIDAKAVNAYKKYLIAKENLGDILTKIIDQGGKFSFQRTDSADFKIEDLKNFISESRQNCFAGQGVAIDNPRLRGSVQLEFQKSDWFYQDIYFSGEKRFIGQEIVYYNLKPVWGMEYFGGQLSEKNTDFLKQVLFELADECRFGKKCEKEHKGLRYEDKGEGTLEDFKGEEKIFEEGKNIYKLSYRGGIILK